MRLKNKKVIVTGGAGFIGSHMVDALIKKGAKVSVIDSLVTGTKKNLNPKAKFYQINITDPKIEKIFKKDKPEYIFHLAFNVLVPQSVENPLIEIDSIAGSINVFQNAKKYGVKKIVFSSSEFIYGNNKNLPWKETEKLDPLAPYAISKMVVEDYLRFYNKAFGLPYVILRYATVYGLRQTRGAMTDYVRKLHSGKQAEFWGDGKKTRDYIYVDDIVRAGLLALNLADDYQDPTFNVGTEVETSLITLYKKIAQTLGKKAKPIYYPDRPGEQIRSVLNCSKIKKALNWQAKKDLDKGLKLKIKDVIENDL